MSIRPEDAAAYAEEQLARIAYALERIAEALEALVEHKSFVDVRVVGPTGWAE